MGFSGFIAGDLLWLVDLGALYLCCLLYVTGWVVINIVDFLFLNYYFLYLGFWFLWGCMLGVEFQGFLGVEFQGFSVFAVIW